MEPAFNLLRDSVSEFENIILILIGRGIHFASGLETVGGTALARILQHVYLNKPFAEANEHPQYEINLLETALQDAKTLSGVISSSGNNSEAQRQLVQNLCQVLLLQADYAACGMPTAMLAHAFAMLLREDLRQLSGVSQEVLAEQANSLTAVFKRISAGKAFRQCSFHKSQECCQSAQAHLLEAFSHLASNSFSSQCMFWHTGERAAQPATSELIVVM